jgi:putative spermidine/putrescine transport system permease protein
MSLPFVVLAVSFWMPLLIWLLQHAHAFSPSALVDETFLRLLGNTFLVAMTTTVSAVAIAYPVALLWWMSGRALATALTVLLFLPMSVGLLARNYSWIGILSGRNVPASMGLVLLHAESWLYTLPAVIVVMTYVFIPVAFFLLVHAFSSVSRDEVNAARSLGAADHEVVVRLALPRSARQAVIGVLLIFASAVGYFVTPRMIGGGNFDMAGNLIWRYTNLGDFDDASAAALSFVLTLLPFYICALLVIVVRRRRMLGR